MALNTSIRRAGLTANLLALGCIVVAFIKRDEATVEAASFNGSVGSGSVCAVSQANPAPWLVAAAVLLVLGTAALTAGGKRRSD